MLSVSHVIYNNIEWEGGKWIGYYNVWKEVVVAWSEVLPWYLFRDIMENLSQDSQCPNP
jgi:hypothetical protein